MTELIASGVELMLVGMGIVYAFLAMLIGAIHVMAALVVRFFPELPVTDIPVQNVIDPSSIAAISAAVHQYRLKHK
jgi:oxaloacetate decarboxylase (Na+ extruding) subunit gamma